MINIKNNFSLKSYNSLLIDKKANYFCELKSVDDCKEAIKFSISKNLDILILGSGTNILLTSDFDGIVFKNNIQSRVINNEEVVLGAGENWHESVLWTLEKKLYGLENLSLIPGTVGAAPVQNIGAYGIELSSMLVSLEAINFKDGELLTINNNECKFGYRESIFKKDKNFYLITSIKLKLNRQSKTNTNYKSLRDYLIKDDINPTKATPNQICRAVTSIRNRILPDPLKRPNVGSFFKNLILDQTSFEDLQKEIKNIPFFRLKNGQFKVPSAYLIEKAGWKGYEEKEVSVSKKHALVLLSSGRAKSEDILNLALRIIQDILEKYNVELELEPTVY